MRSSITDALLSRNIIRGYNRYRTIKQTLGATFTGDADMPHVWFLDPGGAGRTVLLPAETDGLFYTIVNTADADEDLTVKEDANVTTIGVIERGESMSFYSNGTTWYSKSAEGVLQTVADSNAVKLNSRNFTQATGSSIGFQSKPGQNATSTGSVIGGEVSPRAND